MRCRSTASNRFSIHKDLGIVLIPVDCSPERLRFVLTSIGHQALQIGQMLSVQIECRNQLCCIGSVVMNCSWQERARQLEKERSGVLHKLSLRSLSKSVVVAAEQNVTSAVPAPLLAMDKNRSSSVVL